MIYVVVERKYFLAVLKEDRRYDDKDYNTFPEAEVALEEARRAADTKMSGRLTIMSYDIPLYADDYEIVKKHYELN